MQIVEIPVYRISVQLESALRKKEYKEDQIAQAYGILSEKKKKQKTPVIILAAAIAFFGLVTLIGSIIADKLVVGIISFVFFDHRCWCSRLYRLLQQCRQDRKAMEQSAEAVLS